jgi:predicted DNA-binding transcriptional regulator AlpA
METFCLMSRQVALPPTLAPRLISREAASAYVNVSPTTFDEMVKAGKMPRPKLLTGRRKAWDVRGLDIYIDNLPTAGAVEINDDTWSDIDAA